MKKSILIISFVFMLASCATTHMAKVDKAPDLNYQPDKATLVIIRETFFWRWYCFLELLRRKADR